MAPFDILLNLDCSKYPATYVIIVIICLLYSAPVGHSGPKFASEERVTSVLTKVQPRGKSVTLFCDAQGFPVPTARYCCYLSSKIIKYSQNTHWHGPERLITWVKN